jgi:hypothetical protein
MTSPVCTLQILNANIWARDGNNRLTSGVGQTRLGGLEVNSTELLSIGENENRSLFLFYNIILFTTIPGFASYGILFTEDAVTSEIRYGSEQNNIVKQKKRSVFIFPY